MIITPLMLIISPPCLFDTLLSMLMLY